MSAGSTARVALKHLAAGLDRAQPPTPGLVFLIYHRVGGRTPVSVDLPTPLFRDQMAALVDRVVTINDAVGLLTGSEKAGPSPVVVTFDDGTADFVDEALPVLVELGVPVTYYVATDFIEGGRPFPDEGRPMSWSALSDAVATGLVTVGSHTHTHRLLDRVDPATAADELDRSIELIGSRLGVTATHFAYPKALPATGATRAEVDRRFRTAVVARTRPNPYGRSDLHALTRSPIQVADGMRWFGHKADGGMWLEDSLRRAVGRVRHRAAER